MRCILNILILLLAVQAHAVWSPYESNSVPRTPGVYTGVPGGPPTNRTTIFTNFTASATVAEIDAAVTICPSNQVVKLAAGTYAWSTALTFGFRKGVTIRGEGRGTRLQAGGAIGEFITIGGDENWSSRINITAGWNKGSSNLTLASVSGLAAGMLVLLDQTNQAQLVWIRTGGTRNLQQLTRIEAINGNDITIWPPLYYSGSTNTPQLRWVTSSAEMCSVEDLWFDPNGHLVSSGVTTEQDYGTYLKGLVMTNINNYNIMMTRSLRPEVAYCTMSDSPEHGPNHAGIAPGSTSSDMLCSGFLIYDNIVDKIFPAIEGNNCSGGVYGYNFIKDPFYDGFGQGVGLDISHLPHTYMNTAEGNVVNMIQNDGYFGSGSHQIYFRNWAHGYVTHGLTDNGGPVASNFNSKAICLNHYSLYETVVGNVVGYPTFSPSFLVATNDDYLESLPTIYQFGYPNMGGNNYANTFSSFSDHQMTGEDQRLDYRVEATVLLHGNWESFTRSVSNLGGQDTTLPDSIVWDAKPNWFYGMTWPPVVPAKGYTNWTITASAGASYTNNVIPAVYRWFNNLTDPPSSPSDVSTTRSSLSGNINLRGGVQLR